MRDVTPKQQEELDRLVDRLRLTHRRLKRATTDHDLALDAVIRHGVGIGFFVREEQERSTIDNNPFLREIAECYIPKDGD